MRSRSINATRRPSRAAPPAAVNPAAPAPMTIRSCVARMRTPVCNAPRSPASPLMDETQRRSIDGPAGTLRVLVTGATGLLGGAVVRRLLQRDHAVAALHRADAAIPPWTSVSCRRGCRAQIAGRGGPAFHHRRRLGGRGNQSARRPIRPDPPGGGGPGPHPAVPARRQPGPGADRPCRGRAGRCRRADTGGLGPDLPSGLRRTRPGRPASRLGPCNTSDSTRRPS